MVQATLTLWAECAREAARALPRSAWALVSLILGAALVWLASEIMGRVIGIGGGGPAVATQTSGFVGGLLVGLINAAAIGWYLALLETVVIGRRRARADDLRDLLGALMWDVISVLFVFWIASLILGATIPALLPVLVPAATILFNPVPEIIYQQRSGRGMEVLQDAAKFMQTNWPEWLGPHVAAAGVLALWGLLVGGGGVSITLFLELFGMFGPWFGFLSAPTTALSLLSMDPIAIAAAVLLLLFVHGFMLFRGVLYQRLASSSRRSRAWAARK